MSDIASLSTNLDDQSTESYHDLVSNTERTRRHMFDEANAGSAYSKPKTLTHLQPKRPRLTDGSQLSIIDKNNAQYSKEIDNNITQLNAEKMQPKIRAIIFKYVGSEQVVRCLEFAGFISPHVLGHLDENGVRRLEDFVGQTCLLLNSPHDRQMLLGSVFSRHPDQFRLPTGAVLGLLMAAKEIRQLIEKSPATQKYDASQNVGLCSHEQAIDTKNAFCQTEISSIVMGNPWAYYMATKEFEVSHLSSPVFSKEQATLISSPSPSSGSDHLSSVATTVSSLAGGLKSTMSTSKNNDPMAVMNAAIQAAAVAAITGNSTVNVADYSSFLPQLDRALFSNTHCSISPSVSQLQQVNKYSNGIVPIACTNADDASCEQRPLAIPKTGTTGTIGISAPCPVRHHQTPQTTNPAAGVQETSDTTGGSQLASISSPDVTVASGAYTSDEIDIACLERLKQHSSDRASRLAARQFVNADLFRGRDFDMEMELSLNAEGLKRVTGIFYCHLCRVTRERTCAVRFSIARNRYPVLSNVLSHLKTHFQYKSHASVSMCATGVKSAAELSDIPIADTATFNPSRINSPTLISSPTLFFQQQSPTTANNIPKREMPGTYFQPSQSHRMVTLGSLNSSTSALSYPMTSASQHTPPSAYHQVTDKHSDNSHSALPHQLATDQHVQSLPTA